MGLAAPRQRTKISNDPRNVAWANDAESYGQRLMQSQGWKSGDALGARHRRYTDTAAAKVVVKIKDDTLGLGASLKSKDIANQRTGFDAFQGLLGRLNAKDEAELKAVEKKIEDKKLASFAQGRWGGMVFVPGGILVQSDPFKQQIDAEKEKAKADAESQKADPLSSDSESASEASERAKLKTEKKQKKEEKRLRKEQKRLKKLGKESGLPTPDSSSSNETENKNLEKKGKKRNRSSEDEVKPVVMLQAKPSNGRQILRGKNISAKRAAFSDMKGLDEIFMRKS